MYNRLLFILLTISFLVIQNSYSQNLLLSRVHSDAQITETTPTTINSTEFRLLPVKSDGGYISHEEEAGGITITDSQTADEITVGLTNVNFNVSSISVIDASTNDDGDIVLLMTALFNIGTNTVTAQVRRGGTTLATINIETNSFVLNENGRLQYIVLYVPHNVGGGFGNPRVFNTINNIDTQEEFEIFIPRFIEATSIDNIQIAGLVSNNSTDDSFLGSIHQSSTIGVNSKDIVVGHLNEELFGIPPFLTPTGNRILELDFRLGTDQTPPSGSATGGLSQFNNELLGFDLASDGDSYVYMSHSITTSNANLIGWLATPIVSGSPPVLINHFTLPIGGSLLANTRNFSVYTLNPRGNSLVWGTNSTTIIPPNTIRGDINRNYRNYIVARNGRVSILGNYDGRNPVLFSDSETLDISQTPGNTNVLISSWDFSTVEIERWTRIITSSGTFGTVKRPLNIDTDLANNLYFAYTSSDAGSSILPLALVKDPLPNNNALRILNAKINPCGNVFWNTMLGENNINANWINRVSFGFSNSNEIYTSASWSSTSTIHQISNEPILLCESEQLTTPVVATWQNACQNTGTVGSIFTPPAGDGNYSATATGTNERFSNAVWLDVSPGVDFVLGGTTTVCSPTDNPTYTISNFNPSTTTYTIEFNGTSITPTSSFSLPGLATLATGQYTIEVEATSISANSCSSTKSLIINVTNLDFQVTGNQNICVANNSLPTNYTITGFQANAGITYQWQVVGQTGFVTTTTSSFSYNWNNLSTSSYTLRVTATNNNGCTVIRDIVVNTTNLSFTLSGNFSVCNNSSLPQTYTINSPISGVHYTWFVDNNPVTANNPLGTSMSHIWNAALGTHTIRVEATLNGCSFIREQTVIVGNTTPTIVVNINKTYCSNQQINYPLVLNPVAGVTYTWTIWRAGSSVNANAITTLNGANAQAIVNQLPIGTTTEYRLTAVFPSGCIATNSVFITINSTLNVGLNLPATVCRNVGTLNLVGTLDGNPVTGGTYTISSSQPNIIVGNQLNLANLIPDEYEITFTYIQNGCTGTIMKHIRVTGNEYYQIQAFRCATQYNPTQKFEVALLPRIVAGHTLVLEIPDGVTPTSFVTRQYTSGMYWDINDLGFPVPIGTQIKVRILNNNACGGVIINNNAVLNEATITVVEAPAKDIYLKDHAWDFGQQPSGGGWQSPSITISQVAPNFAAAADAEVVMLNTDPSAVSGSTHTVKFYYSNGNITNYNLARNIVDTHNGNIRAGEPNYLYLRVFNRCKPFGRGLRVDALYFPASTTTVPGGLLTAPVTIPQDIEGGGEVIIAIPIENYRVASNTSYHTCSMARIYKAITGVDNPDIFETPGFDLFGWGISQSNNMTWRNINVVSSTQGEGTIDISNDGTTAKMARIKFDFAENQDPTNAHYLENNGLRVSLPYGLAQRWQQNNYTKNNFAFVNNNPALLEIPEHRDAWFEVLLMPGETYTLRLNFDIRPVTNTTPPQESIYHLDITQHNEGELVGGVGYDLMIDFPDFPPVAPSGLNATVNSSSEITLNWTDRSDNELVFILERNKVGTSTYVHVANVNADITTYPDSDLEPYTLYQYRLKALSNTGLSSGYIYSNQVRTLDIAPLAPTDLVASLTPTCKIALSWRDNSSYESRYQLTRSFNGGAEVNLAYSLPANTNSYLDNSFVGAGSYRYTVRVYSSSGAYHTELTYTFNVDPISASTLTRNPTGIVSETQIDLSWNAVPSATGYKLEKKVGNDLWSVLPTPPLSLTYFDFNVSALETYQYRLTTLQGCVSSVISTLNVTTPFLAPTDLSAEYNSSTGAIDLRWIDNSESEIAYILERTPQGGSTTVLPSLGANTQSFPDRDFGSSSVYTYELYAATSSHNSDRISVQVVVPVPTTNKVSGYIRNQFDASPVGNVVVDLVDNSGVVINQFTTDRDGYYEFMVDINSSFTIRPNKDINKMNGVTRDDLVLYRKYLNKYYDRGINIYTVDTYLAIAGDLDTDCDADYDDYELLEQAIYSTNTFSLPSWQFVPSDYDFATQGYCPFAQERSYTNFSSDLEDQDFIGIKTGDITGDSDSRMKVRTENKEEETSHPLTLDVVPNPFSTVTQLIFGASNKTLVTIHIYNSLGVEVYTREMETAKGINKHSLQLDVAAGLYYVTIVGEQINYTSKIVIEK